MADASTTRSAIAYTALVSAVVIPFVEKHWNITLTTDNIADAMAAIILAWHGISSFIESRWPAKAPVTDDMIKQITTNVLAEMRVNPVPLVPNPEQSK